MAEISAFERSMCAGALSALAAMIAMGYLRGLENLLANYADRITSCGMKDQITAMHAIVRLTDEMKAFENFNGVGACLVLDNPFVVELIEVGAGNVTSQMIENARRSETKRLFEQCM